MAPRRTAIRVPARDFQWLPGEDGEGACDPVPEDRWVRVGDVFVYAAGPSGSGRHWRVTVGIGSGQQQRPARGFCLETSTVGWRTLQQFGTSPLPWIERDRGGTPELILWDSFPLAGGRSTSAAFGLVAWVYHVEGDGRFVLDWPASRHRAVALAASYRTALPGQPAIQRLRGAAARALAAFADGACTPPAAGIH